jgi:hypothetical protein
LGIRPLRLAAPAILAGGILLAVLGSATVAAAGGVNPRATHPASTGQDTPLTAGGQAFDIQVLPGDTAWAASIATDLGPVMTGLEDLTGLTPPGGTIVIAEVVYGLNDYGIAYDSATKTLDIPQSTDRVIVGHALAHIWFNSTLFADTWVSEGLATFFGRVVGMSQDTPCLEPAYPGIGMPNLARWQTINPASTIQDQNVSDWQYQASCAWFDSVAGIMGRDAFRNVLKAAAGGEQAYIDTVPPAGGLPVTTRRLLDLIDERGMLPAGIAYSDRAQALLAGDGIFDPTVLMDRSQARAAYHALESKAGTWSTPRVIRGSMRSWDFAAAQVAMTTATQILDLRDAVAKTIPGFWPSGGSIEIAFETAETQAELADVASLMQKMADAAETYARANRVRAQSRSIVQTIGLIGVDLDTPMKLARADLDSFKPDPAVAAARSEIDAVDGAVTAGWLRTGLAVGLLGLILIAGLWIWLFSRRRLPERPTDPATTPPSE